MHLYGKGRVGDGLVSAVWVIGTELAHSTISGQRLQLRHATPFFRDTTVPLALPWVMAQDDEYVLYLIILLFLLRGFWEFVNSGFGIGSCSGRTLSVRGE